MMVLHEREMTCETLTATIAIYESTYQALKKEKQEEEQKAADGYEKTVKELQKQLEMKENYYILTYFYINFYFSICIF